MMIFVTTIINLMGHQIHYNNLIILIYNKSGELNHRFYFYGGMDMKTKSVFVTATGTDIGKTYISGLLVKKMRELNHNCGYYKPALSGAIRQNDGSLLAGDCDFVTKLAKLDIPSSSCVSYCFEEAVSPHLASNRVGVEIKLDKILADFEKLSQNFDYLVVEGAGGITCPFCITEDKTMLLPDVIKKLGEDIVIVADGGLGTINSVLLTVEYAKSQNLNIRGIILNNYDKNDFMHIDNKKQVEYLTKIPVIATVASGDTDLDIDEKVLLNIFD